LFLYHIITTIAIAIPFASIGYYVEKLDFLITVAFTVLLSSIIMVIPTIYIIDNDTLIIREFFIAKTKIDIATIKKIKDSHRNDYIDIRYKKYKQVTIYPKDKYGFINDLKNINPEIEVIYRANALKFC